MNRLLTTSRKNHLYPFLLRGPFKSSHFFFKLKYFKIEVGGGRSLGLHFKMRKKIIWRVSGLNYIYKDIIFSLNLSAINAHGRQYGKNGVHGECVAYTARIWQKEASTILWKMR